MQFDEISIKIENRLKYYGAHLIIKRVFDIMASLILMILLLPVMLIIGVAVKLDSKGPIIFAQKRVGLNGKPFIIYKFRTMVKNAEDLFRLKVDKDNLGSLVFQDKNDARVTDVGKFLRETSLDELPQLVNVIMGNMSLVGPRPEIPGVADYYNEVQRLRLRMKPGITGLAQVSGRGEIELDRTIAYDLEYIATFDMWQDFKILLKTAAAVTKKEGAY